MLDLKTVIDDRGRLTVAERLPFAIKRAYWLYGVDPEKTRGGHAHRQLNRLMVAVSGKFRVAVDGSADRYLWEPSVGLVIPPMRWVVLSEFSHDAVVLVLASEEHDEADCIRDFAEYQRVKP